MFPLCGTNASAPHLCDGLPALEDSVDFFNLLFDLKLNKGEKQDLVAFLRAL
jgi:hypothetical protein